MEVSIVAEDRVCAAALIQVVSEASDTNSTRTGFIKPRRRNIRFFAEIAAGQVIPNSGRLMRLPVIERMEDIITSIGESGRAVTP